MLKYHDQHVIALTISLCLTVCTGLAQANEAQIQVKSKSLAHYIMGVIHDYNGDHEIAVAEYQKSIKFDRKQSMPHLRLGTYYARTSRFNEALKELKTVVQLRPESSQAHYLLALIYSSQKKYDLAASEYEFVLKTASKNNPENIEIYAYLSQLYYALRKNTQALAQLNRILELQPKNVSAMYLSGSIYLDTDQKDKAKESFRKILSMEPEHEGALNSLAYVYAEEGIHLDEALSMARKAVDLDPASGAYYDTLGWVLFKKGFHTESLMTLEKALQYTTDPVIYDHIGDVYKASHEPSLARKFWLKSLALDSKQPKVSEKLQQLNRSSAKVQGIEGNNLTK